MELGLESLSWGPWHYTLIAYTSEAFLLLKRPLWGLPQTPLVDRRLGRDKWKGSRHQIHIQVLKSCQHQKALEDGFKAVGRVVLRVWVRSFSKKKKTKQEDPDPDFSSWIRKAFLGSLSAQAPCLGTEDR